MCHVLMFEPFGPTHGPTTTNHQRQRQRWWGELFNFGQARASGDGIVVVPSREWCDLARSRWRASGQRLDAKRAFALVKADPGQHREILAAGKHNGVEV